LVDMVAEYLWKVSVPDEGGDYQEYLFQLRP